MRCHLQPSRCLRLASAPPWERLPETSKYRNLAPTSCARRSQHRARGTHLDRKKLSARLSVLGLSCARLGLLQEPAKKPETNAFQVLAELKKQQREAPFKAPQMDAPVQYTVLADIPATNPADAHSTKKFGLHQPRPSPGSPSSVTGSSTTATTPRHLACHALDDLCGQDSVRSSDGFGGMCK
jgi:hypothetical protein